MPVAPLPNSHPRPNSVHVPSSRFFSEKKVDNNRYNGPNSRPPTNPSSMRLVTPPPLRRPSYHTGSVSSGVTTSSSLHRGHTIPGISSDVPRRKSPLSGNIIGDRTRPGDLSHHSSTDSLRRQLNVDDASSVTSTSSKASRAKNVCRSCKQEGGQVRRLISCATCTRRYHEFCGDPKPVNVTRGEKFICGKCRDSRKIPTGPGHDERVQEPAITNTIKVSGFPRRSVGHDGHDDEADDAVEVISQPGLVLAVKRKASSPGPHNALKRQKNEGASRPTAQNSKVSAPAHGATASLPRALTSGPLHHHGAELNASAVHKKPQAQVQGASSSHHSPPARQGLPTPLGLQRSVVQPAQGLKLGNNPQTGAKPQPESSMTYGIPQKYLDIIEKTEGAWGEWAKICHCATQLNVNFDSVWPKYVEPIRKKETGRLTLSVISDAKRALEKAHSASRAPPLSITPRSSLSWKKGAPTTVPPARKAHSPAMATIGGDSPPRSLSPIHGVDTPFSPVPTAASDTPDSVSPTSLIVRLPVVSTSDRPASENSGRAPHASESNAASAIPDSNSPRRLIVRLPLVSPSDRPTSENAGRVTQAREPKVTSDTPDSVPPPSLILRLPVVSAFDGSTSENAENATPASKLKQRSASAAEDHALPTAVPRARLHEKDRQEISQPQAPQPKSIEVLDQKQPVAARSASGSKYSMSMTPRKGDLTIRKCENPACNKRVWRNAQCDDCQRTWKPINSQVPNKTAGPEEPTNSSLQARHTAPQILPTNAAPANTKPQIKSASVLSVTTLSSHKATSAPESPLILDQKKSGPPKNLRNNLLSPLMSTNREHQIAQVPVVSNPNVSSPKATSASGAPSVARQKSPDPRTMTEDELWQMIKRKMAENALAEAQWQQRKAALRRKYPPLTQSISTTTDDRSSRSSDKENGWPTTSPSLDDQTTFTSVSSEPDLTHNTLKEKTQKTSTEDASIQKNTDTVRPLPARSGSTCSGCNRDHKKCLHDINGDLDPALCKAWLEAQKPASRTSGRPTRELSQIRDAALKYAAGSPYLEQEHSATSVTKDAEKAGTDAAASHRDGETSTDPDIPKHDHESRAESDSSDELPIIARRNRSRKPSLELGRDIAMLPRDSIPTIMRTNSHKKGHSSHESVGPREESESAAARHLKNHVPVLGRLSPGQRGSVASAAGKLPGSVGGAGIDASISTGTSGTAPSKLPAYTFLSEDNIRPFSKISKPRISVEVPTRRPSPTQAAAVENTIPSPTGTAEVVRRLKSKGVMFEDDSSDEEMEEDLPEQGGTVLYPWQSTDTSKSLYDVAPMLQTTSAAPSESPPSRFVNPATGEKLSKKAIWKNLVTHQLRERRKRYGVEHPHRTKKSATANTMITTTKLQDSTTQPWRDPFDPPVPEKVQMAFSDYMDMPVDPIFERQEAQRTGQEDELAFRDGTKERTWIQSGATRRTRNQGVDQRWHFLR